MLHLTDPDQAMLGGEQGEAAALAMRILVRMAEAAGASRMIDVTGAHIDSCLYHGEAGLDFAERLSASGGRVVVPTTLNVSSLDLLHPALFRGDGLLAERGRRLMRAYVSMGGQPTFTCAPYQSTRPALGEHVAWAESNAIVFANSVLGARTDRYGDFIDICAAITGRVPEAGLHLDEHRRAEAVFHIAALPELVRDSELLYPIVGHLVGGMTGSLLPAIIGLPADAPEDGLKALGAAAASSGGVAMFHAVGRTPEAPTLEAALGGGTPKLEVDIDLAMLREARNDLSTASEGPLAAVSVGTPHFSLVEFERLASLVDGERFVVDFFVNTSRGVLAQAAAAGLVTPLRDAGVEIVTDTCTYITPILRDVTGVVMTNSGKWAYYAPGNLGVEVAFGSLEECVASAAAGTIKRDESVWA
ncbi:MAG: aconitase X catalytic domain-containing protein [Acidimicrobiia bacterium]